ncbi:MAG: redoxin domain-containing protein [Chloroflexi bacterium]|nr:redoxin domain-containing protein [Chloroflexota bacterium]
MTTADVAAGQTDLLAAGDSAPDAIITTADGRRLALSILWQDRPLVLTFLRHLGCIFCREAVARLVALQPSLTAAGADVAVVAPATPVQVAAFCGPRAPGLHCLAEPSGDLQRAFSIGRITPAMLVKRAAIAAGMRALLAGHVQGRTVGDVGWVPAAFVIGRDGRIAYAHYARHPGDHAPDADLLAAVARLTTDR